MGQLAFGPGATDWQERVNVARMRKERLGKAQQALKKHGIAVCLVTKNDGIRYVTGTKGGAFMPQLRYALVFQDRDPILFEYGPSLVHNKVNCSWLKPENLRFSYAWLGGVGGREVARATGKKFAAGILEALKENGLEKEALGFDALDEIGKEALAEVGIRTVSAGIALHEARRTKTQDEILCIKMAIALAEVAFSRAHQVMRVGVKETEVLAEAVSAAVRAGGESLHWPNMRSGPNSFEDYSGASTDRILQVGDMAFINFCSGAISFMGYLTCYYRTFMVGRQPTAKERDWHKQIYDPLQAVIAEIKPGATTADAVKHFPPCTKWGYAEEEHILCKEIGHGIGLSGYEQPTITRAWSLEHPETFEEGMVIAVEGREGEHLVGGSRLEEMVLVTATGTELLTRIPAQEMLVAGDMFS